VPRIERTASLSWEGNAARGTGLMTAGGGAFSELPFSIASRIAVQQGKTSPEELLAAAHGGCLTTSIASELSKIGAPPERLDVNVRVIMDEVPGHGHLVVASEVDVDARVPGVTQEAFDAAVAAADDTCPFSALIRASASVTVRARLAAS
jgi:osmotically inducible protein OsmC